MYILFTSMYSAKLSNKLSLPSPLLSQPPNGKSQHPVGLMQLTSCPNRSSSEPPLATIVDDGLEASQPYTLSVSGGPR